MKAELTAAEIAPYLGIAERSVRRRAEAEGWPYLNGDSRGRRYIISKLPPAIQTGLVQKMENISTSLIPTLAPEAALAASGRLLNRELDNRLSPARTASWTDETAINADLLRDPRVKRISAILTEALDIPAGRKKSKWLTAVAKRHGTTKQTLYKWIKKYEKEGLSGLAHTKSNKGKPKVWSRQALDFWCGLCMKREHRKIAKDALYWDVFVPEATRQGWRIGGYESALQWYNKTATPQLLALQRGGVRALDNALPPVLRSYADLAPFEILVGDQHRFDFWVINDDTGEVIRPEGYFWQDLRTRCFYGGAIDRKYDGYLIGLALRVGMTRFGAFSGIYTDNGKPELGRYIMGILSEMRTLGLSHNHTVDAAYETDDDGETVNPLVIMPGTHKKAIVRNAKAKMVEGTFNVLEGILRDHFRLPGHCKRLTASGEEQEIDQKDIERLAAAGKLLTLREFINIVYQAMDYYNQQKPHRGVLKEWPGRPKPAAVTPFDCLKWCYLDGWRPRWLDAESIDLLFLAKVPRGRKVDRGRIHFKNGGNGIYEHGALIELHGKKMDVRYDPMDPEWILCFDGDDFVCRAVPVEYSSMKDTDLATRKIEQKRLLRKRLLAEFRKLTSKVPDIRNYSKISPLERAAAAVGREKRKQVKENQRKIEHARERSPEELAAEIAKIEAYRDESRPVFSNPLDRYNWCLEQLAAGNDLSPADEGFVAGYEAQFSDDERQYNQIYKESLGLTAAAG